MLDIITTYHLDGIDGNNAKLTAELDIKTALKVAINSCSLLPIVSAISLYGLSVRGN